MTQATCAATTQRGTACRGIVPLGRSYCLVHDPERAVAVREARAKGGAAASKLRALKARRPRLDTAAGLIRFNAGVIADTLEGRLLPDVARAVLYGMSIQRQLVEAGDLEKRLAALEEQAAPMAPRGGRSWGA